MFTRSEICRLLALTMMRRMSRAEIGLAMIPTQASDAAAEAGMAWSP